VLSRVRGGGIEGVGLRRRGRGMGGEVGCVGERSWGLGWRVVAFVFRLRRYRCRQCLSWKVMSCVKVVIFFCVSLVRRP
jgi:hypothetical protein